MKSTYQFIPRTCVLWLIFLKLGFIASCAEPPVTFVKAKVFALNPDNFLQKRMGITGKVTRVGPGDAWFEIEDETGKLIVSSERLSQKIDCRPGAIASFVGSLNRLSDGSSLYFSIEKFVSCT